MKQVLAEDFRAFQLGCLACGTKDLEAFLLEGVNQSFAQRCLGAYDSQSNSDHLGKPHQTSDIGRGDRNVLGIFLGAGITGGNEDSVYAGA